MFYTGDAFRGKSLEIGMARAGHYGVAFIFYAHYSVCSRM